MGLIWGLILGAIAGYIASRLMNEKSGTIKNILLGQSILPPVRRRHLPSP